MGRFYLYAFKGPFWTIDRETVMLGASDTTVDLVLHKLALQPLGTVGADLHVHGAASFDSSLPDMDRVLSFAATDLEVIVSTDHDVIYDYGQIVRAPRPAGQDEHRGGPGDHRSHPLDEAPRLHPSPRGGPLQLLAARVRPDEAAQRRPVGRARRAR